MVTFLMNKVASYINATSLETDKKVNLVYGLTVLEKVFFQDFCMIEPTQYFYCIIRSMNDKRFVFIARNSSRTIFIRGESSKRCFYFNKTK